MINDVTVAVWNQALLCLAQPLLSGPDDDSETARRVRVQWAVSRPAVLRSYPWNCAMRRALLPALVEKPAWGFANAFSLPTGCLRLWEVDGQKRGPWTVEGGRVLTDLPGPLRVRFVADIEAHQMDPALRLLMAKEMAADLAMALTNNATLGQSLAADIKRLRVETRASDAMEANDQQFYDRDDMPDWLDVRR
ncbi:hypothetical protein [Niveispirillum sp.]|uniref:hypothetical protein n=1 Tax=Niveispirillum sp. TaxID=1917217 RepID=UPI001B435A9F|nr:hypothetical protein [Niveispirillum sp.]MBP7338807.1 hypothetical protein [Niveispirillum sp.]